MSSISTLSISPESGSIITSAMNTHSSRDQHTSDEAGRNGTEVDCDAGDEMVGFSLL